MLKGDLIMLYIRLFHGRTNPNQDMDEWGSDGPVFGPYDFSHTTYALNLKLGKNDVCDELFCFEDMLFYDGTYYGDWTVFGLETLEKGKFKLTVFEQEKTNLPI